VRTGLLRKAAPRIGAVERSEHSGTLVAEVARLQVTPDVRRNTEVFTNNFLYFMAIILLFSFCALAFSYEPGIITTIAGNGKAGFSGDGDLATKASIGSPMGVCVDSEGNIFIADAGNYRVRCIDKSGIITTIAGNGHQAGPFADGVPATKVSMFPCSVWVDNQRDLYIADLLSFQVKRVGTDGIITTVAGAGNGQWRFNGDNIPVTKAAITFPPLNGNGICFDSDGNLFIADYFNFRVRRVDAEGIITTVAGSGMWGFNDDNIPAIKANLSGPMSVFVDSEGNLFISDSLDKRIRRVGTDGIITTVAGNGNFNFDGDGKKASEASIGAPTALCGDNEGNIFFVVPMCHIICRVDLSGILTVVAGKVNCDPSGGGYSGNGRLAKEAFLNRPSGLFVDKYGNIFIADTGNHRIRRIQGGGIKAVHLEGRNSSSFLFDQTFSFLKRKSLEGKQPDSWSKLKYGNLPLALSSPPQRTQLFQNFPNPFNPETWIPYQLTKRSHVNIDIYDVRGQFIRRPCAST